MARAVTSLLEAQVLCSLLLLRADSLSLTAVRTDDAAERPVNICSSGNDASEFDLPVNTGLGDLDLDLAVKTGLGDLDLTSASPSIRRTRDLLDLGVSDRGVPDRMERNGAAGDETPRDELCTDSKSLSYCSLRLLSTPCPQMSNLSTAVV